MLSTDDPVVDVDNVSVSADTGALLITQAYFDGGDGLTEGDSIAQMIDGWVRHLWSRRPLVLEGGFDNTTNKDFNVRYKAPQDYAVINPISSLVVAGTLTVPLLRQQQNNF